ncbi:hypothetical protein CEXT_296551 [Caerostris extrusa]|uniref:Uncharacterized protein n=1 Tax=Caerostris extrusa TaxID=172846 RepID=A0AAV4RDJ5_CAEEX|nr:hypothetical protein CEXT_296551 [Caerostris extrusa]
MLTRKTQIAMLCRKQKVAPFPLHISGTNDISQQVLETKQPSVPDGRFRACVLRELTASGQPENPAAGQTLQAPLSTLHYPEPTSSTFQTSQWRTDSVRSARKSGSWSNIGSSTIHPSTIRNQPLQPFKLRSGVCGSEYVKHATHNTNQMDTFHLLRLTTQRTLKAALSN